MSDNESHSGLERLAGLLNDSRCTPEQACGEVARTFAVRKDEVALLLLEQSSLRFVYPLELKGSGQIPLSSSGVAPRTARSRKAELSNDFTRERHHFVFELVRLNHPEGSNESLPKTIQKLISAPLIGSKGRVLGVVQISRKGDSPRAAGANFSKDDLKLLERVAAQLAAFVEKSFPQAHPGSTLS